MALELNITDNEFLSTFKYQVLASTNFKSLAIG